MMTTLFYLGIILVLGALTQWFSPKLRIPQVVGYLVLGVIIGPEVFGLIPRSFVQESHIISDLSLSIIAVMVGATLKLSSLTGRGKEIVTITLLQSIATFVCVLLVFFTAGSFLGFTQSEILLIALLLGSIATATDAATPLVIVRELGAKGRFTSTLLAIVATDDAIALIMFTLALSIGTALIQSNVLEWINLFNSLMVVFLSVLLGSVMALINTVLEKLLTHHKGMETITTLGLIFIVYSLSEYWELEPLLSAMAMGTVMVNTSPDFDIVEKEIDNHLAEIIFMLFFILSAMHLEFSAVFAFPLVVGIYLLSRFVGKLTGSYLGAVLSGSNENVQKYMGLALLPQAGVAIGLALSIQKNGVLEEIAPLILNVVIAATLVHELAGPFFTRYALKKSGEASVDA